MIPADPEELDIRAGEYVLGVLDSEGAREVEAALAANADLRRAVSFWEERLSELVELAPPGDPPAGGWDRIAARIRPSKPAVRVWDRVWLWRAATATATAAAAALALIVAVRPAPAGPGYVALLRAPHQDQAAWVATTGEGGLRLRALARAAPPSAHAFQLWTIAPGSSRPRSLGVIPADGNLALKSSPTAVGDGATLAISVEPVGGSPTGQPTGPVVFAGPVIRTS